MPKLNTRPPKYCRLNSQAVVYFNGKPHYLGRYGSPESHEAYARVLAESRAVPVASPVVSPPKASPSKEQENIAVMELAAAFLDHAKQTFDSTGYSFHRIVVLDFLDKFYGHVPVDEFTPRALKTVREELIRSRRFCRKILNRCVNSIVYIFGFRAGVFK